MNFKKLFVAIAIGTVLVGCNNNNEKGKFTVSGELKNIPDQQVYLEELYFSQQEPQVLDTAEIKDGEFKVSAIGSEQGLYRLRFEKMNSGFIFINDQPTIGFKADLNDVSLEGPVFSSPANVQLKSLLLEIESRRKTLVAAGKVVDSLKNNKASDSTLSAEAIRLSDINTQFNKFIINYIDTVSQPVIALFALGYTQNADPATLNAVVPNLGKRFPENSGITGIVTQYNQMMMEKDKPASPARASAPTVGSMAPEFTMNDTEGKPFSLSQLKGKYVLIDFWASWCAPCRGENPNVVAAYNQYKDKNFTILGVSLDENKEKWLQAIKADKLSWKQVSDLQGWDNATVPMYGYDGIPYNVLIDPSGKIIATSLREAALQQKLAEVLK